MSLAIANRSRTRIGKPVPPSASVVFFDKIAVASVEPKATGTT